MNGSVSYTLVVSLRLVQVALVAVAAITILGSLAAGVNVIVFASLGVFALVCLAFVAVFQPVVRAVQGWGSAEDPDA